MKPGEGAGRGELKAASPDEEQRAAVRKLVKAARVRGEDLTGPDGRLTTITATVLESPLAGEITERLGFDKAESAGVRR
jgi:putative transposase